MINYNNFIRGLIIKNKEVVTAITFMAIIAYVLPYYTVGVKARMLLLMDSLSATAELVEAAAELVEAAAQDIRIKVG